MDSVSVRVSVPVLLGRFGQLKANLHGQNSKHLIDNPLLHSGLKTAKLHNDPTASDPKTAKLHNDTAASDLRTAKLHNDPTASDLKTAETFVTCCVRIRVMALSNYGRLSTQRCCQRKVLSLTIKRQLYFSRNI